MEVAAESQQNQTHLYLACVSENLDIVKFFVEERFANDKVKTLDFERPLKAAHANGNFEVVRYLRERTDFEETDLNQNSDLLRRKRFLFLSNLRLLFVIVILNCGLSYLK
jgi:hypothetical protein